MLPGADDAPWLKTEFGETLPKNAAVCIQWKRCGHADCRCAYGLLHGPYYCLFWRVDGRLRKKYVRQAEGPALQAAYREQREQARERRETARRAQAEWRALRALLRELEREWPS
jgi:hypothetical protein